MKLTEDEQKWIEVIRIMKEMYPNDDLLIINPKTYCGYNPITHKKIRVVQEEYEDE